MSERDGKRRLTVNEKVVCLRGKDPAMTVQ